MLELMLVILLICLWSLFSFIKITIEEFMSELKANKYDETMSLQ